MPVTMRDVAAQAGVSPTVVSHVLHNKAASIRVSQATAERVRVAAKSLGYRMNVTAVSFRSRQTMTIAVLHGIGFFPPRFNNRSRYFAELMDGVLAGAFAHGYSVTMCPKLMSATPEEAINDGRFDGLLWYSTSHVSKSQAIIENAVVPLVCIHLPASLFGGRISSARCDNDQGVGLAVEHLVQLGHRRIGYIYRRDDQFLDAMIRKEACCTHMQSNGLSMSDSDAFGIEIGAGPTAEFFKFIAKYTAIVACEDEVASAVLRWATAAGIGVPDDLSIVGFDSTTFCDEFRPAITSVFQPLFDIGRAASELLVQRISGIVPDPPEIIFPCRLDIRGSTAAATQGLSL